jgi:hypothetical protein
MATKLTKAQAQALLDEYTRQQTAATEAAIAAYDADVDARTAAQEATLRQKQGDTDKTAATAYDKNLIQALADRWQIAEQVANWGLSRSGTAKTRRSAALRKKQVADAAAAAAHKQATAAIQRELLTARRTAESGKAKNAASARKTLAGKVAEKRLTLMKNTEG